MPVCLLASPSLRTICKIRKEPMASFMSARREYKEKAQPSARDLAHPIHAARYAHHGPGSPTAHWSHHHTKQGLRQVTRSGFQAVCSGQSRGCLSNQDPRAGQAQLLPLNESARREPGRREPGVTVNKNLSKKHKRLGKAARLLRAAGPGRWAGGPGDRRPQLAAEAPAVKREAPAARTRRAREGQPPHYTLHVSD